MGRECTLRPLVVEVVSPGERNRDRDYGRKRQQYAARGIPEYWLIDPEENAITVLQLDQGSYAEVEQFTGSAQIESPKLAEMGVAVTLTAGRVLDAVKQHCLSGRANMALALFDLVATLNPISVARLTLVEPMEASAEQLARGQVGTVVDGVDQD